MKKTSLLLIVWIVGMGAASAQSADKPQGPMKAIPRQPVANLNFDQDAVGQPPSAGLELEVVGRGPAVHWMVKADPAAPSRPNILVQDGRAAGGDNYALAFLSDRTPVDAEIDLRFEPLAGQEAQGITVVYRYKNPQEYYVLSADAKEEVCTLWRIKNGKKKQIDQKNAIVTSNVWHSMRVVFAMNTYAVYIDEEIIMAGKDKGILDAGRVGFGTVADATAAFDNVTVSD